MRRLAELRERRALTLRELSEMSGVSADTITKIENGHRKPRPSTLRKLASALNVTIDGMRSSGEDAVVRGNQELTAFTRAMQEKLEANAHKPHWSEEQVSKLMLDLRNEVWELQMELACGKVDSGKVLYECADIGNLAMMISDVTGGLERDEY